MLPKPQSVPFSSYIGAASSEKGAYGNFKNFCEAHFSFSITKMVFIDSALKLLKIKFYSIL